MGARYICADVHDGLATIEDGSVDLALFSPPFWSVRSYLPGDHPNKAKELGSEATPADFLDNLLDVVEAIAPKLAPHGSIAVELGDTYAGSGGAGGDYGDQKPRDGQQKFDGSGRRSRAADVAAGIIAPTKRPGPNGRDNNPGHPLDKSLCGIPDAFALSLAYGWNMLRPERKTPKWRVRNKKAWIRTNPPVGALGDKERPATSYITVATKARDRWFDLDAVRTAGVNMSQDPATRGSGGRGRLGTDGELGRMAAGTNPAGAPPLDWWCHIDAVLDAALKRDYGKPSRGNHPGGQTPGMLNGGEMGNATRGVTGAHLRRALQTAGILHLQEAIDQSPGGYSGAHYAVWPPELVAQLVQEMCPRQVCRQCGQPRRRITQTEHATGETSPTRGKGPGSPNRGGLMARVHSSVVETVGWSDCGHGDNWRPGLVLDPFAGSGTTLAVAHGHGRDTIGIDLDSRNVDLARGRLGMFLEVEEDEAAVAARQAWHDEQERRRQEADRTAIAAEAAYLTALAAGRSEDEADAASEAVWDIAQRQAG